MEICKSVNINLESQLEHYEKLLEFAQTKAHLLTQVSTNNDVNEFKAVVKEEVKVVSALEELEKQRSEICGNTDLQKIVDDSDEVENAELLKGTWGALKKVAAQLRILNHKNSLAMQTSLKVINKVISAIQELHSPQKNTYSRVRRPQGNQGFQAVNIKI